MSMISEFVEKLREKSALFSRSVFAVAGIAKDYKEAADIIEELSAKLASTNKERSRQYYKGNSEFVEKLVDRLEELRKSESDREDYSDNHDYYEDWEYAFEDGASDGRHYAYVKSIKIIKELAEEYKDVPDANVGNWIPCEERLPEIFEDTKSSEVVLICGYDKHNDYSWQAMGFYVEAESIKRWFLADCKNTEKPIDWIDIIAWQPLPQPYKGE